MTHTQQLIERQTYRLATMNRLVRLTKLAAAWKITKAPGKPIIRLNQGTQSKPQIIQITYDNTNGLWRVACVRGPRVGRKETEAEIRGIVEALCSEHELGTVEPALELAA